MLYEGIKCNLRVTLNFTGGKRMKPKFFLILLALVLTVVPLFSMCKEAPALQVKPIELKVASFLPMTDHQNVTLKRAFDKVEKLTKGKVRFTYYPAQTLVTAKAAFEGTVEGRCDIFNGALPCYNPGRFLLTSVIDLPPNIPSAEVASVVYWDFFKNNKLLQNEWKEVKVLAGHVQVPHDLHTTAKPIRTMGDLKGLEIRTVGVAVHMVKAWGGTPVFLPMSEAYTALQKGICDGMTTNWGQLKANKLADVLKYHTRVGVFAASFFIIMNWDSYNSLPPDVKKVFDDLSTWLPREFGKSWDRDEAAAIDWTMAQGGHTMITLTPEERAKWVKKATAAAAAAWLAGAKARGLPGEKILDAKYKAIEKYIK